MANQQSNDYDIANPPLTGKTFFQMNASEKLSFLGKVVVMLVTGGFLFPNVFVE